MWKLLEPYNTDKYEVAFEGRGIKLDYIGKDTKGGFIGIDLSQQTKEFTHIETGTVKTREIDYAGIRTGYKFMIADPLYVTPWFGAWKNTEGNEKIIVNGDEIKTGAWDYLLTIHLGLQF